ncbi:Transposable element P transposase [Aphis craccivora]|uniref:Transposable element P transposase n=1 Tax=Aphis craccivora TaxID=307492 RepID=A0A6G0X3U8_APHCR|nr:Transposable element P transposase [Aphis craccivora]
MILGFMLIYAKSIPQGQCELIKEIFSTAKVKNTKNRKYSENWIMLCLLFQISLPVRWEPLLPSRGLAISLCCTSAQKSPSGYKYLRNQNILPLPCVNTILFDEIFLRQSLSVNTRSLTYLGFQDYGDGLGIKIQGSEKADHALVLMLQTLADSIHQPIAVFTSKGSVKGIDLAKIVVKAILLLENIGIQILGITSDGASTNRTMWNILGIVTKANELNNSFENPFDNKRKVFVFSDAPHLLKTVRNRLYNNKNLRIDSTKAPIKWSFYEKVFYNDSKTLLKVCPKVTKNHIKLNNLTKMKVKYASQVLKEALEWLNYWETNLKKYIIKDDEFLTKQTADGLRITIKSTLDLIYYLLNECIFSYVLTYKMNQNCLEKFFGIIRQVAGPNDHPSTPTYLQLYRILSVYSLIKPPKTGNCTILEENKSSIRQEKKKECGTLTIFSKNTTILTGTLLFLIVWCIFYLVIIPDAELVNLKTRGFLTHPNKNLYLIIQMIEVCFEIHAESPNVFEETCEDFFSRNFKLTFPCGDHKSEIVTKIFVLYITTTMRQFSYAKNQQTKKQNKYQLRNLLKITSR